MANIAKKTMNAPLLRASCLLRRSQHRQDGRIAISEAPFAAAARRGRGALTNASGRFEPETRIPENDGLGACPKNSRRCERWSRRSARKQSSRAIIRPTSPSTVRSIRIAAASTAAPIATRAQLTPISGFPPVSISKRGCSPRPMRRRCSNANWSWRTAAFRNRDRRKAPEIGVSRARVAIGAAVLAAAIRIDRVEGDVGHGMMIVFARSCAAHPFATAGSWAGPRPSFSGMRGFRTGAAWKCAATTAARRENRYPPVSCRCCDRRGACAKAGRVHRLFGDIRHTDAVC